MPREASPFHELRLPLLAMAGGGRSPEPRLGIIDFEASAVLEDWGELRLIGRLPSTASRHFKAFAVPMIGNDAIRMGPFPHEHLLTDAPEMNRGLTELGIRSHGAVLAGDRPDAMPATLDPRAASILLDEGTWCR
jgi:hypothetical protein